ncbi:MAG: DUF2892 domain-containing protein [Bacteroidetes bacterium]|nr:DUF2892 domain-containing protein [Bacteroidota bacterium]
MKQNIGTIDRIIRAIAGIGIMGAGYVFESWWGLIGLVFFATSLIAWCPLYIPLGLTTKK